LDAETQYSGSDGGRPVSGGLSPRKPTGHGARSHVQKPRPDLHSRDAAGAGCSSIQQKTSLQDDFFFPAEDNSFHNWRRRRLRI
jgi:hypothetical protein